MDFPTTLDKTLSTASLLASLAVLAGGCLIPSKPTECSKDSECHGSYGVGSYCTSDGICGERTRQELLSPPCDFGTTGPAFEEGTRHIGVTLKLTEPDSDVLIEPVKQAIDLAINDINASGGVDGHDYAAIYCDNEGKTERARGAAKHLAELGVSAMVGPGFSSHTLEVAPDILVPADVMMITPSATSPQISGIDDKNLVWRTAPSDVLQGSALVKLVKHLRSERGESSKLGMSTRNESSYANGLKNAVVAGFDTDFLDSDRFFSTTHRNPSLIDEGNAHYSNVANEIANQAPNLMMVWGVDEVWDVIWKSLQAGRSAANGGTSPLASTVFVTADGAKRSAIAEQVAEKSEGHALRGRVLGTSPGTLDPDDYEPYKLFQFRWNTASTDGPNFGDASNHAFISYGYDAVYLFAFASAAAGEFTGPAMADAMGRITNPEGKKIVANQSEFQTGVTELKNGNPINFQGATGPLKFDENGDPKNATIELWCFQDQPINDQGDSQGAQITSPGNLLEANSQEFQVQECQTPESSPSN